MSDSFKTWLDNAMPHTGTEITRELKQAIIAKHEEEMAEALGKERVEWMKDILKERSEHFEEMTMAIIDEFQRLRLEGLLKKWLLASDVMPERFKSVREETTCIIAEMEASAKARLKTAVPEGHCELCGEPLPEGEKMFRYHGYRGPCPTKGEKCPRCKGSGKVANPNPGTAEGPYMLCPDCNGTGKVGEQ